MFRKSFQNGALSTVTADNASIYSVPQNKRINYETAGHRVRDLGCTSAEIPAGKLRMMMHVSGERRRRRQ